MTANLSPIQIVKKIVVSGAYDSGRRGMIPAVERASNGDLLIAFTENSDHHKTDDGVLTVTRSSDNGRTWSPRRAVAAEPGFSCFGNHGMTRLSDGTLLLHVIRGRHHDGNAGMDPFPARGAFTRSNDDGSTWEPCGPVLDYSFLHPDGRGFSYGKMLELTDGVLMAPFYGVPREAKDPKRRVAAAVFSYDRGLSWPDYSLIYQDLAGRIDPSETDFIRLSDGRVLAMMRSNAQTRLYKSYSEDEGKTWRPPVPTGLPGQCPALVNLESGTILCAFRDRRPDHMGVGCAVSRDSGESWEDLRNLYRGGNWDCGYPSMVLLENGEIYCAFYTAAYPEAVYGTCEIHGLLLKDNSR